MKRPPRQILESVQKRMPTYQNTMHGERKYVSVLFSDLCGYTAMCERLDAEEAQEITRRILREITQIVKKYEGFIEKYIGDAVVAIFGIPKAHDDDPIRAIRVALEIDSLMDVISTDYEGCVGKPLRMHTGINTGLVVTGEYDSEKGAHGTSGDALNLAARLCSLAKGGEILVAAPTYHRAGGYFIFDQLSPATVKGKANPVEIYRVTGIKQKPSSIFRPYGLWADLIGRSREMALLMRNIHMLTASGQGSIVSVIGNAGIGKSRLVAEVKKQTRESQVLWLEGRAISYGHTISYWPLMEMIRKYAGIAEEDSDLDAWQKLENKIVMLFGKETAEILPYLAIFLEIKVRGEYDTRIRFLNQRAMWHQIFRSSRRLFERLAEKQPVVLEFEDLHWADQSTVELLMHLLPLVHQQPILILVVMRPENENPTAILRELLVQKYFDACTEIVLSPFSHNESVKMLCSLLGIDQIPSQLQQIIMRKTAGNPLYVEEVVLSLIHTGAVRRDEVKNVWQIMPIVGAVAVPETLRALITARIDRLDEDLKQVLMIASVIGRVFFYRVLEFVYEDGQALDKHLAALQERDFIRQKSRIPELEYIFNHPLIREATYDCILLKTRKILHRNVGMAIETMFSERLEEFYGLLAYHYTQAEEWVKAQDYLFKAGTQSIKKAAAVESLYQFKKAKAAYENVFGKRSDPFLRATMERQMGEAHFRRGEHQLAIECLLQALVYLGHPLPTSSWGIRYFTLKNIVLQVFYQLTGLGAKKRVKEISDATIEEIFRNLEVMGWIDFFMNRKRFFLMVVKFYNFAIKIKSGAGIVRGAMGLGLICDTLGKFKIADYYHNHAVATAEQGDNPVLKALAYLGKGIHRHYMGQWDSAIDICCGAAELYKNVGEMRGWASATLDQAVSYLYQGDFTQSMSLCQELIEAGQEGADNQMWGWGLCMQGSNLVRMGAIDEATHCLNQAIELLETVPDYYALVDANSNLGLCFLQKNDLIKALHILENNRQLVRNNYLRGPAIAIFCNALAEAYLLLAEGAKTDQKNRALRQAKLACKNALRQSKRFKAARPQAYRLQGGYLYHRKKYADAKKWWMRSLESAKKLGAKFEEKMTLAQMVKCSNSQEDNPST